MRLLARPFARSKPSDVAASCSFSGRISGHTIAPPSSGSIPASTSILWLSCISASPKMSRLVSSFASESAYSTRRPKLVSCPILSAMLEMSVVRLISNSAWRSASRNCAELCKSFCISKLPIRASELVNVTISSAPHATLSIVPAPAAQVFGWAWKRIIFDILEATKLIRSCNPMIPLISLSPYTLCGSGKFCQWMIGGNS